MEAAVDKMVAAQARLAAAGDSCPNLDHLLEAIAGVRRAEELIPANAMSGGGIALPKPMPNMPKSVPLFKGLFECVKAGTLGTGSIGYFTISPLLLDRLGTGLGPYAQMFESGGRKGFDCRDPSELEHMAAAGFFGSLSILQLLATSLLQVQLGGGERSKAAAVDRIGLVMKAVWGARPAHALKQRLERQHWVPRFPAAAAAAAAAGGRAQAAAAGTSPAEQAQRECQQGIMQDFEEHCGLEGQAALDAIWEAAATLRLAAASSMQSPSKAQLQAALCDAQALLDRCTSTPATARHLTSLASAGTVAANLSQWLGLPLERRQALVALLEEALARADAQKSATPRPTSAWCCPSSPHRWCSRASRREAWAEWVLPKQLSWSSAAASWRQPCPAMAPASSHGCRGACSQCTRAGWPRRRRWAGRRPPARKRGRVEASLPAPPAPPPRSTCAACRGPSYCSKECQTKDWKAGHKQACKQAQAQAAAGSGANA